MACVALRPVIFSQGAFPHLRSSAAAVASPLLHARHQHRSTSIPSSYLVTPKELNDGLKKNARTKISTSPRVIPLCAAWFMPNDPEGRTGIESFKKKRIPQARYFDIDDVKDPNSPYPHMLPTKERFAEAMQSLGIRRDDEVVVYDTEELGLMSAPRVGWTLRYFGHPNVRILNNFRLWVRDGYPTESGEITQEERSNYQVDAYNPEMVVDFAEMKQIGEDYGKEGADSVQVLDARPAGRWAGKSPEPRPELSSGHMPGSVNVPFVELLDPETKTLLPEAELRKVLESKGVDPSRSIISSCGSGVTAAVIDLALHEAGYGNAESRRLYDGSWSEWAARVSESNGLIRKEQ
ncbi:thiosulfate sulfurtransferase [Coccidioides immitis RS]|uniref:Thiosulfate sulfurtransferase n=1 Tax=Coccidioides immitis (strain RS) TaxID=246410 RepID=J3K4T4_COCIM|nr:thiosulfate sulfurtransferase [Coccidioides immitis RS]EAS29351.3 thiosulfate sulfurtransferase [Coccidioides immitis RS]